MSGGLERVKEREGKGRRVKGEGRDKQEGKGG